MIKPVFKKVEKTLAWMCGSEDKIYTLERTRGGSYVITCNGITARICSDCDGAESMDILMAMAALDQSSDKSP